MPIRTGDHLYTAPDSHDQPLLSAHRHLGPLALAQLWPRGTELGLVSFRLGEVASHFVGCRNCSRADALRGHPPQPAPLVVLLLACFHSRHRLHSVPRANGHRAALLSVQASASLAS